MFAHVVLTARWEANLLTSGESNHTPKYAYLTIMCIVLGLFGLFQFEILPLILLVLIYPCLHYFVFDWALNHFRDLYLDYKTGPSWIKFLSLIVAIALMILSLKYSY